MKTYYSIVKVVPNSLVGDSISVGMILSDDEKFFIKFSDSKIKIAKSLLGNNKKAIDFFIEQLISSVEKENISESNHYLEIFEKPKVFSAKYFNYLSNYNNNIIQYNQPKYIKEENNLNTFTNLFKLLIDSDISKNVTSSIDSNWAKARETINLGLIKRVENQVHTNIKITSKILPSLYFNYEMDCIGLNGVFIGAKSINLNQTENTIQKELSNYYALATILENAHGRYGKKNNFYLISDEPQSVSSKEHLLWEKMIKLKKFELIPTENVEIIASKIEETNALKFL